MPRKYELKKGIAAVLIGAMTVTLAACGSSSSTTNTAGTTSSDTTSTTSSTAETSATTSETEEANTAAPVLDESRKSTANSDERYDKVVISLAGDPQDLAPQTLAGDQSKQYVYYNFYESLFDLRDGEYVPILAKSYEDIDDTHTQVTIYDYIYDSAGNHITADDVVFSYNLLVDSGNAFKYDIYAGIEKVDDYTVEFTWTEKPDQVGALEWPWCRTNIVSEKSYEDIGGFSDAPIATGPYVVSEYVSGSHLTLEANDNYWQTDELRDPEHQANVQTIEYDIITEDAQNVVALNSNQIQYTEQVPSENLADFENSDDYGVYVTQGSIVYTLIPDCSEGSPLADKNLRLAIFYAIDNEAVATSTGASIAAKAFGTPFFGDYNSDWENEENYINTYDPELAKEYLEQSDYDGETLVLEGWNTEEMKSMLTMVQALLTNIGINVELSVKESALVQTDVTDHDAWDLLMWNPGGGSQVGAWNRPINYNEFGTGENMAFLHDETLQDLFMTAYSVDGHTEENMTAVHDYVVDNAYFDAIVMPVMNAVYSKDFATLVYREHEFLRPGSCEYYLD